MVSAADVNIHRLRLRVPRVQEPRVTASLHTAQWPSPAIDEWLFIRRIQVRAAVPRVATLAASEARLQAGAAADGESPGAVYAAAVRFTSLARLLTCLSWDLFNGRAAQAWFWRRWAHLFGLPSGKALALLWEEHAVELPEVTAQLSERGRLHRIWQAFAPVDVSELLQRIVHALDLPRTVMEPQRTGRPPLSCGLESLPVHLRARWRPVLDGAAVSDTRARLAAVLVALEWHPTYLFDSSAAEFVAALAVELARPSSAHAPEVRRRPRAAPAPKRGDLIGRRGRASVTPTPAVSKAAPEALPTADQVSALERGAETPPRSASSTARAVMTKDGAPLCTKEKTRAKSSRPPAPAPTSPPDGPGPPAADGAQTKAPGVEPYGLYTAEGGLFLLLNFLERPEAQSLLAAHGGMAAMPSGWAWLYRLGEALGMTTTGTMARWLAERMELVDVAQLKELPPLPGGSALVELGERLYRQADAAKSPWGSGLLHCPALVSCTRSHLDVCYPLARASLPVRQTGLDLDPGWIVWLGRVVKFHYVHSPLFEEAGSP